MEKIIYLEYIIAVAIRYWLFESDYNASLANRIEVSTPLNAWKRVIEGVVLFNDGTNPYIGDMFHESPLVLLFFSWITKNFSMQWINVFFICCDMLTSFILYKASKVYLLELFQRQKQDKDTYADDVDEALLKDEDSVVTPLYVLSAYLFNPYCVLNCIAKTTTVLSNLFLSFVFYSMLKGNALLCCAALALCTLQSLYPVILIVPVCLYIFKISKNRSIFNAVLPVVYFAVSLIIFLYSCHIIVGDWSFIDSTFNFILNVPDLRPNIGLFWYFFTEMFEHFRPLFLCSFQINATILYLSALSIRLRNEPVLLAATLTALIAIFKSYPSIGDVGFYIALLPMWKHLFQFMQQGFIVTCFFVGCSMFAPTVWHLWIYSGSANANFYFGVTLAFATTQIFLVTDLLFAYIKREFMLKHGITKSIEGRDVKLVLD
ncbi:phosphatidylinositol glycan anchor biosynthesis class U protein [Planococcus citri]|uniref:phosphatidylinositol glycan anchor biosynthesis class U protein n=1 Tax=Planococcus citri TaxID=170843 RepID=UPI0031F9D3A2